MVGLCLSLILAPSAARATTTVYYDEAAFLAAADAVSMESFEGLTLGTVSDTFVLPSFTVTADQLMQGKSILPFHPRDCIDCNSAPLMLHWSSGWKIGSHGHDRSIRSTHVS